MLRLRDLLNVLPYEGYVHIGTELGQGWRYSDTIAELVDDRSDEWFDFLNREVSQVFLHHGRAAGRDVYGNPVHELKEGIGIIVTGSEDGDF